MEQLQGCYNGGDLGAVPAGHPPLTTVTRGLLSLALLLTVHGKLHQCHSVWPRLKSRRTVAPPPAPHCTALGMAGQPPAAPALARPWACCAGRLPWPF